MEFTGRRKPLKNRILVTLLIVVPIVLIYSQFWGRHLVDIVKTGYGWGFKWNMYSLTFYYFAFSLTAVFSGVYILVRSGRFMLDKVRRRNTYLMAFLILFGFLPGYIVNVMMPFLGIEFPPIGNVFPIFWAIGLVYSMTKHRFLAVTPETAAENILATMPDALLLTDPDGDIIAANRASAKLSGYSQEELHGANIKDVTGDSSVPGSNSNMLEQLQKESAKKILSVETQWNDKEGRVIPVLLSASAIVDRIGQLRGAILIARDITSIKETQDKLKKVNEKLIAKEKQLVKALKDVEKTNEDLKASQDRLVQSEKLASLGRLVADIAHEVNNPLMIITGRAQLAGMGEIDQEKLKKDLKIIVDQCERAKSIIHRLLLFSQPSKGQMKRSNINEEVEVVVELLEYQFGLSDITFKRKYAENIPEIEIDDKQIHEAFMNLFKNASEAMPDGGTITVETSYDGRNVHIAIKDTGSGIKKENIGKIFDPFFSTKQSGTGLGLSVTYGILRSHGGELKYESDPAEGTTANIILPVEKDSSKKE
jgi:PAS domain S-box-containing protein